MSTDFEEIEPEFAESNTIACTTFLFNSKTYTISTCRLSGAPNYAWCRAVTILGDIKQGNTHLTNKDYETMLFIDGSPHRYPFGGMPGNAMQGIFQRYDTESEARDGHSQFVERVKQTLSSMGKAGSGD